MMQSAAPPRRKIVGAVALCVLCVGALGGGYGGSWASQPYSIQQQSLLVVRLDFLRVSADGTLTLATRSVELADDAPARIELSLPWSPRPDRIRLELEVAGNPGPAPYPIQLHTVVEAAGVGRFEARRSFRMAEGSSYLMEAYERQDHRLLVASRAELVSRPVVVTQARSVGPRVAFTLEVERVLDGRTIPLETNRLNTFLGLSVEYSFRRGAGESEESLRARLRPVELEGDLAEVEVELAGSLPAAPERLRLDRRETLWTTRGATSALEVTAGDPPTGYRFRITPDF